MSLYRYRCSTCQAIFSPAPRENTAFCPSCLEAMRAAVESIDARTERVRRSDLTLFNGPVSDSEREEMMRVRREGNFTGVIHRC